VFENTGEINRRTIRLPRQLHRQLKILSAETGKTLQLLMEEACEKVYDFGDGKMGEGAVTEQERPRLQKKGAAERRTTGS